MFLFLFFSILILYFTNPISILAVIVPPVIPDSINTNKLFSGSFDPQYPNKDFVPNNPSGITCEYKISAQEDIGTTGTGGTGTVIIDKKLSNQKIDFDNRLLNTNLYQKTPCKDTLDYEACLISRDNSMDTENTYGASSPIQRQLPQSEKNKLFCQRWHSGILSGKQVIDTDERVGCYCGGDSYNVDSGGCSGSCREVYFSELAFFNTDFCSLSSDISSFYNCGSGDCPMLKREPKFTGFISSFVAKRLMKEASIVPKGSIATRVTQEESNKSTIAAVPFLMAPSKISTYSINSIFPAKQPPKISTPPCSPVNKPTGPDEYKIDFIAEIIAIITGSKASGDTTIKQEYSSETIDGLSTASYLNTLSPQSQLNQKPPAKVQYSANDPNNTILVPATSVKPLLLNLTPASWQHL